MKFVQKITYDLGSLEYYRDELRWNVNSIEEVIERLEGRNDEELRNILGCPIDYECWAEETEV